MNFFVKTCIERCFQTAWKIRLFGSRLEDLREECLRLHEMFQNNGHSGREGGG